MLILADFEHEVMALYKVGDAKHAVVVMIVVRTASSVLLRIRRFSF